MVSSCEQLAAWSACWVVLAAVSLGRHRLAETALTVGRSQLSVSSAAHPGESADPSSAAEPTRTADGLVMSTCHSLSLWRRTRLSSRQPERSPRAAWRSKSGDLLHASSLGSHSTASSRITRARHGQEFEYRSSSYSSLPIDNVVYCSTMVDVVVNCSTR